MMHKIFATLIYFPIVVMVYGQDAYHSGLSDLFQNQYNLPTGDWIFFDNEDAILNNAIGYGGAFNTLESEGTDFEQVVQINIAQAGNNPWDAGWNISNRITVNRRDKVVFIFHIRSVEGQGKVNVFAENAQTFVKEAILTVDVAEDWTTYIIPFESSQTFNVNSLVFGFHLAHQAQQLEIGGFTAMNFGANVSLEDLPSQINNEQYGGFEEDAPWRTEAAERIERLRKANLNIEVKDSAGNPFEGAQVRIKMLRHAFAFGSAINANKIAGNNAQNVIYENKIINLDGEGHGFNWVVFENDMKWPALEQQWFVDRNELVHAVQWLNDRDIIIRGHTLVWPGASNMPPDITENRTNLGYIKDRIDNHLEDILSYPGIAGHIVEWDVLNEITTNRSLENYFRGSNGYSTGREILAEIFQQTRALDSTTGLWLNDFVTLSLNSKPGNEAYDNLKIFTQEFLDAGIDLQGIGFQGHIGSFPNGIPSVLETLDDFYDTFGLQAKITEFDLPPNTDEALAAKYLRDFLTAIFSHESMNGFVFWNFWDGASYKNTGANLFRSNWRQTPAGDAFIDLVFKEWWSNETVETAPDGSAQARVFKGLYEITYETQDGTQIDTVQIVEDASLEIIADNIITDTDNYEAAESLAIVFPNPVNDVLNIQNQTREPLFIELFDPTGRTLIALNSTQLLTELPVSHLNGLYQLRVANQKSVLVKQVIIH